jgi:hypothetical protein
MFSVNVFQILPSSAHSVTPAAARFLLDWLHQDAHEYKQWSSAISLGLVSTCLHATDWKHKHGIIDTLLKVRVVAMAFIQGLLQMY